VGSSGRASPGRGPGRGHLRAKASRQPVPFLTARRPPALR
jgi:hypothetical protein